MQQYATTPAMDYSTHLLEPLDVPGLAIVFESAQLDTEDHQRSPSSPSSIAISLYTPDGHRAHFGDLYDMAEPIYEASLDDVNVSWELDMLPPPPPAPMLKDLDSFTDGTGMGSFDYSLEYDSDDDSGPESDLAPTPPIQESVAFSPANPCQSIEIWRDDVLRSTSGAATPSQADPHNDAAGECTSRPGSRLKRHLSSAFNTSSADDSDAEEDAQMLDTSAGPTTIVLDVRKARASCADAYAAARYLPRRRQVSPERSMSWARSSSAPASVRCRA